MQLKQLEYLLKIAECGSITQAANQLFISQPSLTKAIMQLEREYGIQILVRKPRGIELTEDGKNFIYYAKGVIAAANVLEDTFSKRTLEQTSRLFVGTQQLKFVYDVFLKTYQKNPSSKIHYNLIETDRNSVSEQVLSGEIDIGIIVRSNADARPFLWQTGNKRLEVHSLDSGGVYACVGPRSPFYNRKTITFEEAESKPNLVLDMGMQEKQNRYFETSPNYFNMDNIIFFNTISACEHFLRDTDSLLYIAKWAIGGFDPQTIHWVHVVNDLENTDREEINNELIWIKRAGEPLNPAEKTFVSLIEQYCAEKRRKEDAGDFCW